MYHFQKWLGFPIFCDFDTCHKEITIDSLVGSPCIGKIYIHCLKYYHFSLLAVHIFCQPSGGCCTPPCSHCYGCLLSSFSSVHWQTGGNATRQLSATCASLPGASYKSVHSLTSSVYAQQAIHVIRMANASLINSAAKITFFPLVHARLPFCVYCNNHACLMPV